MPRRSRSEKPTGFVESDCATNYQIEKELFRSQNGAVFKARRVQGHANALLGQVVCLKERRVAELGAHKDMMNEVKLLQSVQHPNVVKCFGSFRDPIRGSLFIVLEYVDGGDLWHELQRRKNGQKGGKTLEYFSEASVWRLFYQICQGLHALHRQGIVHRDIKSLNILLSRDHTVAKIADLGVSRQVSNATAFLTTCYGTPLYASPEICKSSPYDEKTDLWSLGVVLYEMAALVPPFVAPSLVGLGDAIKAGRFAPLPKLYSSTLSNLVASLLQLNPEKRPAIAKVLTYFKAPSGDQTTPNHQSAQAAPAEQLDSEPSTNNALNPSREEPQPSRAPIRSEHVPARPEEERVPPREHREEENLVPQRRREGVPGVEKKRPEERLPVARDHRNDHDARRDQQPRKEELKRDDMRGEEEPRRRRSPSREERRDYLPEKVEPEYEQQQQQQQHQHQSPLPPQLSSAQWRRAATELRRKKLQLKNLEAFAQAHAQAAAATAAVDGEPTNKEERGEGNSAQLRRRRDQESLEVARVAQQIELLEALVGSSSSSGAQRRGYAEQNDDGREGGDLRRRQGEEVRGKEFIPGGDVVGNHKQRHYLGHSQNQQEQKRPMPRGAWNEKPSVEEGRRALAQEQRQDGVRAPPPRTTYAVPTYSQEKERLHPPSHRLREPPLPSQVGHDHTLNPPLRRSSSSAFDPPAAGAAVPHVVPDERPAAPVPLGAAAAARVQSPSQKDGPERVVGGAPASPAPRAAVLVARAEEVVENPLLGFGERHKVVDPRRGRHMAFNNNNNNNNQGNAAANRNYLPNQQQQQQAPPKAQQQVAAAFEVAVAAPSAPALAEDAKAQERQRREERRLQQRAERFNHVSNREASPIKVRHKEKQRENREDREEREDYYKEELRERPSRSKNHVADVAALLLPEQYHHKDQNPPGVQAKVERESIRQLQARSKGNHRNPLFMGVQPPSRDQEADMPELPHGEQDPRRDHRNGRGGERLYERSRAPAAQPPQPTGRSTARFNLISGGWT